MSFPSLEKTERTKCLTSLYQIIVLHNTESSIFVEIDAVTLNIINYYQDLKQIQLFVWIEMKHISHFR